MDSTKKNTNERQNAERAITSTAENQTLFGLTAPRVFVETPDPQSQTLGATQVEAAAPKALATSSIDFAFDDFGKTGELASGGLTDDRTPTLIGKAQPNTRVAVYDGEVLIGNAYADASGSWYFPVPILGQGEHVFTTVNAGVTSDPFTLSVGAPDSSKPSIDSAYDDFGKTGELASGALTDDKTPTLIGKAEPGAQVKVYDGKDVIGTAYADASGNWYFPVPTLGQGEHVFTVVTAGVASDPFTLTVGAPDSSKPSIDSAFDDFGKTGELASGALTDDKTPTLIGKAEPGTQVKVYDGKDVIGTAYADTSGNWYFPVPTLGQGEHVFTVATAGVASDPFTLTVGAPDSSKPSIDSAFDDFGKTGELASGALTDDKTPTLIGKAEPGTQVKVYDGKDVIGTAYADTSGNWYFPVPTLGQGEHVFTVATAGVASDPFTLTVGAPDSSKPSIDFAYDDFGKTGELASGGLTDDKTPTLNGNAEPGAKVAIYDGSARIGFAYADTSGSWYFPVPTLGLGEHVFTVVTAGVTSDPFTLTIGAPDSIKPFIDSVIDNIGGVTELVSGSITDDARPTFQGQGEPNTRLKVYDNGKIIDYVSVDQDGHWTYTGNLHKLSEGEHVFTFAGDGVTSEPFVLNVQNIPEAQQPQIDSAFDNAGPLTGSVANGGVIDDDRPVLSGRGEPDAGVFVYNNSAFVGAVAVDGDGNWTFQPSEFRTLSPGTHSFTVEIDGVRSEPFVLIVEAPPSQTLASAYEALPSLSDLLQPASELFVGETQISPICETALELSLAGFNDGLGLAPVETTDGISVFSPVATPEPWYQEAAHPLG